MKDAALGPSSWTVEAQSEQQTREKTPRSPARRLATEGAWELTKSGKSPLNLEAENPRSHPHFCH